MATDQSNSEMAKPVQTNDDVARQIAQLIFALRARGFTADTRQAIALERLLRALGAKGKEPGFDLAGYIGPIFCRSQEEQRRFREVIDSLQHVKVAGLTQPKENENSSPTPSKENQPVRKIKAWWFAGIAACAIIALVLIVLWFPKADPSTSSGPTPSDKRPPIESTDTGIRLPTEPIEGPAKLLSYQRVMLRQPLAKPSLASWLWASVPLMLLVGWLVYQRIRRPRLRRESSEQLPTLQEVRLPGSPGQPFSHLRVKELGRALRIRQRTASRELNTELTIQSTLNNGGLLTPVFEAYVEPRYLVLFDHAGMSDHFARLSQQLVHALQASNVDCVVYDFDRDPTYCNVPADQRTRGGRFRIKLSEILDQQPDRPLLILSDGANFINPITHAAATWCSWVADRPRVLITPADPKADWTIREVQLRRYGFHVVPLTPKGIPEVATVLNGISISRRIKTRLPFSFEDEADRCLSRFKPKLEYIDSLCDELRDHLGADGFLWLASLAAYPEIHWGLTLRLGASLLPMERWEQLLPRLSRLVWLRHGYMPDWLREALLCRLSTKDERAVRQLLIEFLSQSTTASKDATHSVEVPLKIVVEQPQSLWEYWHRWWHNWESVQASVFEPLAQRIKTFWRKPGANEQRERIDYVYLRFLSGNGPGWLTQLVPEKLLKAIFPNGWMFGPTAWAAAGLFICSAMLSLFASEKLRQARFQVEQISVSHLGEQVITRHKNGQWRGWRNQVQLLELRHLSGVNGVAFSPNGLQIGTCAWDGSAFVWDAGTGNMLFPLKGHTDFVTNLAYSNDGRKIVTGSWDKTVRVWNTSTGKSIHLLEGHTEKVESVAFSPNGELIVSGAWDGTARVWSVETGKSVLTANAIGSRVSAVAFSPDSRKIVCVSYFGGSQVLDALTGKIILNFAKDTAAMTSVAFSPDGQQIVTGSEDSTGRIWDAQTGVLIRELKGHADAIYRVAFSLNSELVITGSFDRTVRVWSTRTGESLREIVGHSARVTCVAFSSDGQRIVTGSADNTARVWQLDPEPYDWIGRSEPLGPTMSADGKRWTRQQSGKLQVFEVAKSKPLVELRTEVAGTVAVLSDDGMLLAVAKPNEVSFYKVPSASNSQPDSSSTMVAAPIAGTWSNAGKFFTWNKQGRACLVSANHDVTEFSVPIDATSYLQSPDERWLTLWSASGALALVDLADASLVQNSGIKVAGVAYSYTSKYSVVWDENGEAYVYITTTVAPEVPVTNIKTLGSSDGQALAGVAPIVPVGNIKVGSPIRNACISQSGKTVATLLENGNLPFHVVAAPDAELRLPARKLLKEVQQVVQGADDVLAVVFKNGSVQLFDAEYGVALSDPLPTSGLVTMAAFSKPHTPKGERLNVQTPETPDETPKPDQKAIEPKSDRETKSDYPPEPKSSDEKPAEEKPAAEKPADEKPTATKKQANAAREPSETKEVILTGFLNNSMQLQVPASIPQPTQKQATDEPGSDLAAANAMLGPPAEEPIERRQALVLTTQDGNIEVWEINNAGRGYVLLLGDKSESKGQASQSEAESLVATLEGRYGFLTSSLLTPTLAEVQQEFQRLKSVLNPNDRLIVIVNCQKRSGSDATKIALDEASNNLLAVSELSDFLHSNWAGQKLVLWDTPIANTLHESQQEGKSVSNSSILILTRVNPTASQDKARQGLLGRLWTELNRRNGPFDVRELSRSLQTDTTSKEPSGDLTVTELKSKSQQSSSNSSNFYFPAPRMQVPPLPPTP